MLPTYLLISKDDARSIYFIYARLLFEKYPVSLHIFFATHCQTPTKTSAASQLSQAIIIHYPGAYAAGGVIVDISTRLAGVWDASANDPVPPAEL